MNDLATENFSSIGRESHRSPGRLVRDAREARRWTIEYVAGQLRLPMRIIEGLEKDDYQGLPPATFIRGYLRNYARLLELPEQEVMDAYHQAQGREEEPGVAYARVATQVTSRDRRVRWVTYLVLLSVVALPVAWWWKTQGSFTAWEAALNPSTPDTGPVVTLPQQAPVSEQTSGQTSGQAPGQAPNAPAVDTAPGNAGQPGQQRASAQPASSAPSTVWPAAPGINAAGSGIPKGAARAPAQPQGVDGAAPLIAEPEEAEVTPPSTPAQQASASTPPKVDTVVLRFDKDAWVKIVDSEGKRLLYQTAKKGTTKTVQGKAPFKVILGNAESVSVELNGQPFDAKEYERKGGIARFDLGAKAEPAPVVSAPASAPSSAPPSGD